MGGTSEEDTTAPGTARLAAEFLREATGGTWMGEGSGVSGVTIDTRLLRPGGLFVAIRGAERDGHAYLSAAREAGAGAALVARPDPSVALPQLVVADTVEALGRLGNACRRRFPGPVCGITGSCGKTSTKEMLTAVLGPGTRSTPGNFNNLLGLPISLAALDPESDRAGVFEAGMNEPGEMARLAAILEPDDAIVTTIAPAHLEKVGSLDGIAREKAELPRRARGRVVLGPACAGYAVFRDLGTETHVVLPGEAPDAGFSLTWRYRVEDSGDSRRLRLDGPGAAAVTVGIPVMSAGMTANAALVVTLGLLRGLAVDTLAARLGSWTPLADRGRLLREGDRPIYCDHYNANPGSLLDAAREFDRLFPAPGRCWVIGSMEELGPDSEAWHRACGRDIPFRDGDFLVAVGPRGAALLEGAASRPAGRPRGQAEADAEAAGRAVARETGPVFVKGSRKYRLEGILPILRNPEERSGVTGGANCGEKWEC